MLLDNISSFLCFDFLIYLFGGEILFPRQMRYFCVGCIAFDSILITISLLSISSTSAVDSRNLFPPADFPSILQSSFPLADLGMKRVDMKEVFLPFMLPWLLFPFGSQPLSIVLPCFMSISNCFPRPEPVSVYTSSEQIAQQHRVLV